jgi:hypothetical protein
MTDNLIKTLKILAVIILISVIARSVFFQYPAGSVKLRSVIDHELFALEVNSYGSSDDLSWKKWLTEEYCLEIVKKEDLKNHHKVPWRFKGFCVLEEDAWWKYWLVDSFIASLIAGFVIILAYLYRLSRLPEDMLLMSTKAQIYVVCLYASMLGYIFVLGEFIIRAINIWLR